MIFLGGKPDPQDTRDRKYSTSTVTLPESCEVPAQPRIIDQGATNSCAGHAAVWFWEQVLRSRKANIPSLSPWYVWFNARRLEGTQAEDSGVGSRTAMQSLQKFGACPIDKWGRNLFTEPNEVAIAYGNAIRLPSYERVETVQQIRLSISTEKQSVCIGVPVFESWKSSRTMKTGLINYDPLEPLIGHHLMVACGYDDGKRLVQVANSWGKFKGDKGFFFLPYDFLNREHWDGWTVNFSAIPNSV